MSGRNEGLNRAQPMRWALLAMAMAGTATMPATAGSYCIKGCEVGGASGDCSFASYQQCQATAAGRGGWCEANPDFNAKAESLRDSSRQSRRRR